MENLCRNISGEDKGLVLEDLTQIYYINKEISIIQQEISELEGKNFYHAGRITDMPRGGIKKDEFAEYAEKMKTLRDMLWYNLKKLQMKRAEIETFLEAIEDGEMRLIMRLRCVNNMKWEEIAREIGLERTTVSKKFNHFLKKCKFPTNPMEA